MPHINSYTSGTVDNNRVDLGLKYCNATRFIIAVQLSCKCLIARCQAELCTEK